MNFMKFRMAREMLTPTAQDVATYSLLDRNAAIEAKQVKARLLT